jgi:hypothetical protein
MQKFKLFSDHDVVNDADTPLQRRLGVKMNYFIIIILTFQSCTIYVDYSPEVMFALAMCAVNEFIIIINR